MRTPARILIVEDDGHLAAYLATLLETNGYAVAGSTDSGEQAVELAAELRPDLVLMDILLQGAVDGIRAAQEIDRHYHIPVLYLTGQDNDATFERAKVTHPFGYLLKPVNERELVLTIEMALYRHRTESELRRHREHLAEAQRIGRLGSWEIDPDSRQLQGSEEVFRILGLPAPDAPLPLERLLACLPEPERDAFERTLLAALEQRSGFELRHRIVRPDGEERVVQQVAEVRCGAEGRVLAVTGTLQDITELHQTQQRLWRLAHHDPLSGLPNRILFCDRVEQALARCRRRGNSAACLFVDLDDFKAVNDRLGHSAGDLLIVKFADRLRACVRETDTVARIGGDEFALLLEDVDVPEDAEAVAGKLIEALTAPFDLEGEQCLVGASIGIALYPRDASGLDHLLKCADRAMYRAKQSGKNQYLLYARTN